MQKAPSTPVIENVRAIGELERQAIHQRTGMQRVTEKITAFAGSSGFISGHVLWFFVWVMVNRGPHTFDPYPYNLLNVIVSLEAIFLTSFVLITQNRMTKHADHRAHLDLQVNLLAEEELTAILQMLYALCQKAGTCARVNDSRVQQLLQKTDVIQLALTLEKELKPEQ
ncbi:MAG TPA: DUF1003 domain-containing protein [Vicinamibacterales bacterium]|jgi:uncharacterized membrane protein